MININTLIFKTNFLSVPLKVTCCGLCIKSHKYRVYDQQRQLQFTAIQDLQRFGSSDYTMGSKPPLVILYMNLPILIIHFGAPKLFDFVSSVSYPTIHDINLNRLPLTHTVITIFSVWP